MCAKPHRGLVHGGRHDLLCTHRHLPADRMQEHLRIAREYGLLTILDGLVPGHNAVKRLRAVHYACVQTIWVLLHYYRNQNPSRCARIVAETAHGISGNQRLWLCPVNEPTLYPLMAGMPIHEAMEMAITIARVARHHHPEVGILTNDPITSMGERQFAAPDAIVSATEVDVVGVNYHPHRQCFQGC